MSDRHDDCHDPGFDPDADSAGAWQGESRGNGAPAEDAQPLDLARLAEWLPRLGAVLWLDRHARPSAATQRAARGGAVLLIEHPALAALLRCGGATAHTQVTPQGPREWICFRDAAGEAQAKLYLLPDTDYLAWDEMAAATALAAATPEPTRWHAHTAFLRQALARHRGAWRARLLAFDHHRLPWLRLLDARPPLRISLLGLEFARSIARGEGAELMSPLHSA